MRRSCAPLVLLGLTLLLTTQSCADAPTAVPDPLAPSPQFSLTLSESQYDDLVSSASVEGSTLAAAGYSGINFSGYFEATTLYRNVTFVGLVDHTMHWSWSRDGVSNSGDAHEAAPGPQHSTRVNHPVDCTTISDNGRVSATTDHRATWIIDVVPAVGNVYNVVYDLTDSSNDAEDCPAPQVDWYDAEEPGVGGGSSGGGGAEAPGDADGWCMVRFTYLISTGEVIDIEVLYCW